MTHRQRTGWRRRGYTHQCYRAGWGEPNPRCWIDRREMLRRLAILRERYASIGVHEDGRRHDWTSRRCYVADAKKR